MKNYYKPTDIHLVHSLLSQPSISRGTSMFSDKDKNKILESYLSEEFDRLYPIFEEYHIPRGFDRVIDNIVSIINEKLMEFKRKNFSDEYLEKKSIEYLHNIDKPIELLEFIYDAEKKECFRRKAEDSFDNTHEFPIVLYFYESRDNNPMSIERKVDRDTIFVKFNIHLPSIINFNIKELVRHEIVHIVERFTPKKDLKEFNESVNKEVFDHLRNKYDLNDVISGRNFISLFSESEIDARVNELYERIISMSNEKIEGITRSDYSIKIKGILKLFKENSDITLFSSMKAFVETIDECINGSEIPDYLRCFAFYNYKLRKYEYKGFLNDPEYFMNIDYLTRMAEYFDKITKKFETKCYKVIYKALEDKGYYNQKSEFQRRLEESNNMPYLVFESQEIYYIVNIDNEF